MKTTKPRILIVDDAPENIHVLMGTLRDGYAVTAATGGRKALDMAFGEHPPDLILLDVMMPEMDGYEVIRRLKKDERTRDIPVIFVTAKAEETDELKGFELGAVDYITKPVSPPKVQARVRTQIALESARKTLEIQNRELVEAARLREDVERIMRHDLKSPLNAIIGIPQLLLAERGADHPDAEQLRMIEDAGYRMLQMVNLSLDLMKMERGSYPLQQVDVDLFDVLGKIARETATLAGAKGVELRVTVNGEPPANGARFFVLGEELLCYSMVSNLVKNAMEASPENRPVEIDFRNGPEAEIRIRNAGSVPEAIRERFFDKYVTAEKSGGTGLGTYSARLIAETQGGAVALDTSETGYTAIAVRMPAPGGIDSQDPSEGPTRSAGASEETGVRLQDLDMHPLRVLVADDDPFGVEVLTRRLAHPRIAVDTAANGREAVERFAAERYDLLFMDLEMPVLDGLGAVREIRAAEKATGRRPASIYALSAHDDEATRDRCLTEGCSGYLVKPVDDGHLVRVLVDLGLAAQPETPAGAPRASSGIHKPNATEAEADPVVVVDADLEDLVPDFLDRKRDEVLQIPPLVDKEEFESVRKIAHKLKGSFNIYGFSIPARLGAEIESAAVDQDVDRIRQVAAETLDYLDRVTVTFEPADS